MGKAPISMGVRGGGEFERLSRDLRKAPKELRKQFRDEIKKAGKPAVADVRRAALAVEVTSTKGGHARPDKSSGLRAAVAKATGLSITSTGIRIQVSRSKLGKTHPPQLAKYLDFSPIGKYRRWRHPVFGNKNVWVQQKGQRFWFPTLIRHKKHFSNAVLRAMDKTAARITKG